MCDTNHKKVHQWDIKTMVTIKSGRGGVAGVRKTVGWEGRAHTQAPSSRIPKTWRAPVFDYP